MPQRLRRLVLAAVAGGLALGLAPVAQSDALLEPDEAFRASARLVAGDTPRIEIAYRIAPGYYLYRDRFRVATQPALPLGELEQPSGMEIEDPFVGRVRIFRDSVSLNLPLMGSVPAGLYRLRITAQGCAEERFCYRPFVQNLQVEVGAP